MRTSLKDLVSALMKVCPVKMFSFFNTPRPGQSLDKNEEGGMMQGAVDSSLFESMILGRFRRVKSQEGLSLVVVLMIMVLLLSLTGASLMFSGLDLKMVGNLKAGNQAFYAADSGVYVGVNQLSANLDTATAAFSGSLDGNSTYRSGHSTDSGPQPLQFLSASTEPGYSIGSGTGYNSSGYLFYRYQINVTGTGPVKTTREVEAIGEYGPVSN